MRQSCFRTTVFLGIILVISLLEVPVAKASDFTIGLKAWNGSLSSDTLDGDDDLFFPGGYFAWGVTDRLWISAGYVEGEVDFTAGTSTRGSIEEVDADLIVGWSFPKLDIGIGYRFAEFTTIIDDGRVPITSSGPMVFLGGGNLFGQSRWGYYWGAAYMFEDMDDDDLSQEHFNGEGGFRWSSQKNFSILFGYRYKEYSGDGTAGLSFDGPVVNLAYTWR